MSRLKNFVLLATLACGVAFECTCQAQVYCLQYPVYYDGVSEYLYYADIYTTNDPTSTPPCGTYEGDDYIWVTPPFNSAPQPCGTCQVEESQNARQMDRPFPGNLPASTFQLGIDINGKPLPAIPSSSLTTPSAGISIGASSLVWLKAKTGPIPVKLFGAYLDYSAAGVPKEKWPSAGRSQEVFVGIEVNPDGLGQPTNVYTPAQLKKRVYAGSIDVKAARETHTYHIVSKTPLF